MIEEQRLHHALKQVDQIVIAPDVSQLMGEDGCQLVRSKPRHGAGRQQDNRTEPADGYRGLRQRGFQKPHRPADPEPMRQALDGLLQPIGSRAGAGTPDALHPHPTGQEPDGKQRHANDPADHDPRQTGLKNLERSLPPEPRCWTRNRQRHRRRLRQRRFFMQGNRRRRDWRRLCDFRQGEWQRLSSRLHGRRRSHSQHGGNRRGHHHHKRQACGHVTDVRRAPAQHPQRDGQEQRHSRALPDEMHERPAYSLDDRLRQESTQPGHFLPPSISSRSSRMSVRSSGETFFARRACITSVCADPPKARSSRSRVRCRRVCSLGSLGR